MVCGIGLLGVAGACGGKSSSVPGAEGGASAQGGSGNHAGSGGGGQAQGCHAFDDELATSVAVNISNQTSGPIYLGDAAEACGSQPSPLFGVDDAAGEFLLPVDACRRPCQQPDNGGCTLLCAPQRTILLNAGEVLSTSWSGLYTVARTLPASCSQGGTDPVLDCQQAKRVEPGSFVFRAVAGTSLECQQRAEDGSCIPCTPAPEGGCETPGSFLAGTVLGAATPVMLNEAYGVYPAAAADPSSGSGAGPNTNARLSVELVFTTP